MYLSPGEHVGDGDLLPEEARPVSLQVLEGLQGGPSGRQHSPAHHRVLEVERRCYWYGAGAGGLEGDRDSGHQ